MKVAAIIQTRVGSTRLKNKATAEIEGKTMLEHVIERLKASKALEEVIVAVPDSEGNETLTAIAEKSGAKAFAGSEENVLERFLGAAKKFDVDVIVRVGGDQPLISAEGIEESVERHLEKKADYTFSRSITGVKDGYALGTGVEVVSTRALEKVAENTKQADEKEHVTLFIRRYAPLFKIEEVSAPKELVRPGLKLTVDTDQDLQTVKAIFKELYKPGKIVSAKEAVKFLDEHPEIASLNSSEEEAVKKMRQKMIVIRADSNPKIGIGCITRSLNLADSLKGKYPVVFITEDNKQGVELIKQRGYNAIVHPAWKELDSEIEGSCQLLEELAKESDVLFIVEYKILNDKFIKGVSKIAKKTVVIANYPKTLELQDANAVINANVFPGKGEEEKEEGKTAYYRGPKYIILAKQFENAGPKPVVGKVQQVLVTMGGADKENAAASVVKALDKVEGYFKATIVVGPIYAFEKELRELAEKSSKELKVEKNIPVKEMFELMKEADLAISAAGISLYELCSQGTPTIVMAAESVYGHQLGIANAFAKANAAHSLGLFKETGVEQISKAVEELVGNKELRKSLSEKGQAFVDGKGLERAKHIIEKLAESI